MSHIIGYCSRCIDGSGCGSAYKLYQAIFSPNHPETRNDSIVASCPGAIDGCDFAGVIVAIGATVFESRSFRVGDRVCGAVHGSSPLRANAGSFSYKDSSHLRHRLRMVLYC
ncbi:hypothetical protein F4813DRAFT_358469 [Daldinia decipiens]|uniref:uncharacterized protein n=1 Tax=Daldinia decipiens TaxID=326647 RepID=UPI0020C22D03|nr:uncharacterized protein F4813DRAFT_358469 [Daldinia decipiens]KAI1657945.1 hypothetical protein F4813DRAFT_358469 [Daldinia decipiens]